MVAHSWHRDWLEEVLSSEQEGQQSQILQSLPSPYISLPVMSIVKIARQVILLTLLPKYYTEEPFLINIFTHSIKNSVTLNCLTSWDQVKK